MDDTAGVVSWNSQLEKVISDEGERSLCFSWLHDRAEKRYSSLSTYITLPSIVMATLSGSASIGIGQFITNPQIANTVIGIFTLTVAILTTVQSYFAWAKRSESHRISAISYKKMYRFILIELALARSERMSAKDMLKMVRDDAQRLAEISPQIPDPIIGDFKKKFGDTTPEVTKPEITNGLDPIYVYPSDLDSPLIGGIKGKMSEAMLDPMYRSPRPSVLIPGESVINIKSLANPLKTSTDDRTQDTSQTSSSVHLPNVSEADNSHT
jgi:hypothetical protein